MDTKKIYIKKLKNLDVFYNKLSEDEVKTYQEVKEDDHNYALMNPLMIFIKIIKLR